MVVCTERAARLKRVRRDFVIHETNRSDELRGCKRRIGRRLVTHRDRHCHVAVGAIFPNDRRVGFCCLFGVDKGRQWLVIDRNHLGGVACLLLSLRDHEGNAIADTAYVVGKKNRSDRAEALGPTPMLRHEMRRNTTDFVSDGVRAAQHTNYTRRIFCRCQIDFIYFGVRMGRQDLNAVTLARQYEIGDEFAGAGREALILNTADGLSDAEFHHERTSLSPSSCLQTPLCAEGAVHHEGRAAYEAAAVRC